MELLPDNGDAAWNDPAAIEARINRHCAERGVAEIGPLFNALLAAKRGDRPYPTIGEFVAAHEAKNKLDDAEVPQ
jgi:hypothetical protein